jgi:hypothetical protein
MTNPHPQLKAMPSCPTTDKLMPPRAMAIMPSTILRSQFSLKTIQARTAVRTLSKLSNNADENNQNKPFHIVNISCHKFSLLH